MSSDYGFYAGILRFVAKKTESDDREIRVMMGHLSGIATAIEHSGRFVVERGNCESAARAFAGVAKFLQERILPEALSAGNEGENKFTFDLPKAPTNPALPCTSTSTSTGIFLAFGPAPEM